MVKWFEDLMNLGLEEVTPMEFYRDIFPEGCLQKKGIFLNNGKYCYDNDKDKYCGIAIEVTKKIRDGKPVVYRYSITDDLETIENLLKSDNFVLLSPISYVGKTRTTDNARIMYAFALEIDNLLVDKKGNAVGLRDLIHQMRENILPCANYVVTSGNGVHLYFLLDTPIRLFENVKQSLSRYKRFITRQFWTSYITFDYKEEKIQFESAFQGFRLVGGVTKNGDRTHAFRLNSHPVTIEYLNEFVFQEKNVPDPRILVCYDSYLTLKESKEKYPEWYQKRIVEKQKKGTWTVKRDLYDWWFRRIKEEIRVGHRYHALMLLSIYAIKCNISYEELERDCFSLLKPFDNLSEREDNRFEESDVASALQVYQDKNYATFPINSIVKLSGLKIEKNKRNGRKQLEHIKMVNGLRKFRKEVMGEDEYKNNGRPKGSGEKKDIVCEWRIRNPYKKKIDCFREEKLSRVTIDKWWNFIDENTDYIPATYNSFSVMPFKVKIGLYKEIAFRYKFTDKPNKKELVEKDFIHEMQKLVGLRSYERAKIIYNIRLKDRDLIREKNRKFIELKNLIKRQATSLKQEDKFTEFCDLINQAKTEEKLSEICEKFNILPNLELF